MGVGSAVTTRRASTVSAKVYIAKDERYENAKILASAAGQHCTVCGPRCLGTTPTVVWCHSPFPEHGKAGSVKAHDIFGCYGCQACHDWLDGRVWQGDAVEKYQKFHRAMARSWLILVRTGVLQ